MLGFTLYVIRIQDQKFFFLGGGVGKCCNAKLNSCSVYIALVEHVHLLYFTPSLRSSGSQHEVNARETQCEVSGEMGEGRNSTAWTK